ncbi:ABC transporter permease [Planomonospora sp. ID82291]|uniref:ABC transporter permease n=1 Tax=Planomonospora sp. ID82291 TaxID=2738136 RepID=UPI0018C3C50A|nr:ABC transporter permease [Planomonospora sp. ID82291]MBG0812900.1 ABC transporter permease [Planomonospora sp. ID82291]
MTAVGAGNRVIAAVTPITRLWIVPVAFLGWEAAARLAGAVYFPPPSAILARLHELWFSGPPGGLFLTQESIDHLLPSLGRLFLGWAAACSVAVAAGVALGRSPAAYDCVNPLIHFFRSIPSPMLIPIAMTLTGVGTPLQLAAIVFGVVWPVLINTLDGARQVDRMYLETCEVFGVSRTVRLVRIILPAMAPKVFAGLRISVALALIMMIISEYIGSTEGIGYRMLVAQSQVDILSMWTAIVLLGILGFLLNTAFLRVERHLLTWHRKARRTG